MNVKELKEWLADVPDNIEIVAEHRNDEEKAYYFCEPLFDKGEEKLVFIVG